MKSSATMRLKLMHISLLDTCSLWFDVECANRQSGRAAKSTRVIRRARSIRHRVATASQPSTGESCSVQRRRPRSHRGHR